MQMRQEIPERVFLVCDSRDSSSSPIISGHDLCLCLIIHRAAIEILLTVGCDRSSALALQAVLQNFLSALWGVNRRGLQKKMWRSAMRSKCGATSKFMTYAPVISHQTAGIGFKLVYSINSAWVRVCKPLLAAFLA